VILSDCLVATDLSDFLEKTILARITNEVNNLSIELSTSKLGNKFQYLPVFLGASRAHTWPTL
jgi:hypothetical protein